MGARRGGGHELRHGVSLLAVGSIRGTIEAEEESGDGEEADAGMSGQDCGSQPWRPQFSEMEHE